MIPRLTVIPDRFVANLARLRPQVLFRAADFERAPVEVKLASEYGRLKGRVATYPQLSALPPHPHPVNKAYHNQANDAEGRLVRVSGNRDSGDDR